MTRLVAAMVVLLFALSPVAAQPAADAGATGDPSGDERVAAAVVLFDAGDFASAAIIFESVYNETKRSDALFGWAQTLRLGGNCAEAIPLYRRYLKEATPEPHQVEATEKAIALCPDPEPTAGPTPEPDPEAKPPAEPDPQPVDRRELAPSTSTTTRDSPGTGTDWVGVGLAAGAVTGVALGATFYGLSRSASSDADDAPTYDEYASAADRAETRQTIALVATGVGVTAAASLLLWRWLRPSSASTTLTVSPLPTARGAIVSLSF